MSIANLLFSTNKVYSNISAENICTAELIEQKLNALLENPKQLSKYQTHFPRISAMSELLKISHFKTGTPLLLVLAHFSHLTSLAGLVKNIWISVLLIAIANTLLYNYFESGVILGAFFRCRPLPSHVQQTESASCRFFSFLSFVRANGSCVGVVDGDVRLLLQCTLSANGHRQQAFITPNRIPLLHSSLRHHVCLCAEAHSHIQLSSGYKHVRYV